MIDLELVESIEQFYNDHKDLIDTSYYKESDAYTNDRPLDLDTELFQTLIDSKVVLLFEIYSEENFAGYISLMLSPSILNKGETEACIEHIVLNEEHRGKGLGKELLNEVESLLLDEGVDEIKLAIPSTKDHDAFASSVGYEKAITTHIKRLK